MYSLPSNVCTTSEIDDDDDVEELVRPASLEGRFQGERVLTWVEHPRQELLVHPHLLRVHPSDFGQWLEARQDSPLSNVLLLRCKTETRGCDGCREATEFECQSASPGMRCVACQAGQRTFCLRLSELPCQKWDDRKLQEYRLRRRWWINEAGRAFYPDVQMSATQTIPAVQVPVTETIPASFSISGARPKSDSKVTVAEHARGALSKLGGLVRGLSAPLASSPIRSEPTSLPAHASSRRLSDIVISDGRTRQMSRTASSSIDSSSPSPARLQDQLLAPILPQPFTIYHDPSVSSGAGGSLPPFPVLAQVPRTQLQLQGRTPFDSLPRQHSPYASFQRGVEERLGSTRQELPQAAPLNTVHWAALQRPTPVSASMSQLRDQGLGDESRLNLSTTRSSTEHGVGSAVPQGGGAHVAATVHGDRGAQVHGDPHRQDGARGREVVSQPGGRSAERVVDSVLGVVDGRSEAAQRCLTRMGELGANVQELREIMNELANSNLGGIARDQLNRSHARAGSAITPVIDSSAEYVELRRRGNEILRQQREGLRGAAETPPPPYSPRQSPSPTSNPGRRGTGLLRHAQVGGDQHQHGASQLRHGGEGPSSYRHHAAVGQQRQELNQNWQQPGHGDSLPPRTGVEQTARVGGRTDQGPRGGEYPLPGVGENGPGGGGGGGGGGDGGGNGGGDGGGDGDQGEGGHRRPQPQGDPGLSGAVVNLLLDRIRCLEEGRMPPETPRVRQKPVSLPTPTKELDGSVRTTSVYRWLRQVAKAVDDLGLDRSYTLYQLANEAKLPSSWREVFSSASDLESAFLHLRQRIPPLDSCFPELVGRLTGQPATDGSNERVIERCGDHLSAISDMVALFPRRDINREQLLAALASVGSTEQLQAQMVATIKRFDQIYLLPPEDPSRLSYLEQLRRWLEEERSVRVDIIASIKVGRVTEEAISTVTSFVTVPVKGKNQLPRRNKPTRQKIEQVQQKSAKTEGGTQQKPAKTEVEKAPQKPVIAETGRSTVKSCGICNDPKAKSHPPWLCSQLPALRQGRVPKPPALCSRCCAWTRADSPHSQACGVKRFTDKNGVDKQISWQCTVHGNVHYLLCVKCGPGNPTKPVAEPALPVIGSLAAPLEVANPEGTAFPKVVFMSELLTIQSKTGEKTPIVCYYDSMGGFNFTNQIPGEYNHGEHGAKSQPFNLSTLNGVEQYSLPLATVKVSRHGQWESVELMVTPLPSIPCVEIARELLDACKIEHLTPKQCDDVQVKMILGAQESHLFPTSVPTHKALLAKHPGLRTWRSKLSGRLLLSGRLNDTHPDVVIPSLVAQLDSDDSERKGRRPRRRSNTAKRS